jgi:hypothetical protein
MRAHDPYTLEGRIGLRRVVNYERSRFGWVRWTVADRILAALEDEHARPANAPELRHLFDVIAHDVAHGNVAGVALSAVELVEMADRQAKR